MRSKWYGVERAELARILRKWLREPGIRIIQGKRLHRRLVLRREVQTRRRAARGKRAAAGCAERRGGRGRVISVLMRDDAIGGGEGHVSGRTECAR